MAKEVDAWLTAEAEAAKNGPPAGAKSGGGMQMLLSGGGASCVITNESDPFQIVAIAQVGADVEILFASCADHVYQLQSKTEMTNATWETVATIAGDNSFTAWVATNALASNYLFWRVKRAPREADSDFDFWRDGAELDAGYDATDAGSHPDYDFNIDGGVDVVTNAQLQFDFPGLLADFVILSESITMSNSVTNAFVAPLTFTLLNTNDGLHTVFLQLLNTGGTPSPVFGRTIELDTHPPTVSITAPSNGVTVATRRVNLTGFAADASTTNAAVSDARRPLQTTVTGDFVNDRATNGVWWAGPQELAPGTNSFVAVATDRAGWTASNSVWFVYDPTLATNLPVFTVDVTNTITVASNTTTIALSGWINDDNATVQIAIIDPTDNTITNAIVNAAVHGANWWGEVPMLPGSNRVVVIAQNAGSAPATNSFTAIQDPNVFLAINNPAAGSTANTNSVLVVGMASTNFTGTITINGGAAATSLTSSGIVFSGSASINNIGANLIEIQATGADGSVVTTRATVYGYEFLRWAEMLESSSWHVNDNCWYIEHFPHSHPYRSEAYGEFEWNVPDTHYSGQGYGGIYAPAGDCLSPACGSGTSSGSFHPLDDLFVDGMGWFRSTAVINGHHLEPSDRDFSNCVVAAQEDCIDAQEETVWAGRQQAAVSFIKHWPVDEEQTVVLHFGDMIYWTGLAPWWQGASEPEKITFWGQKGIFYSLTDWGSTNVGFVVKIKTNTRYTISENDFTFPTTQATQTYHWPNAQSTVTEHASAHMLQYWGLANTNAVHIKFVDRDGFTRNLEYSSGNQVMVGEKIALTAEPDPSITSPITPVRWEIAGSTVRSYTQTLQFAQIGTNTTADLEGKTNVVFHWIAGGKELLVSYFYLYNGQEYETRARFNALRPKATFSANFTTESPAVGIRTNFNGYLAMMLGSTTSTGITWSASVSRPALGGGSIAIVQVGTIFRFIGYFGGLNDNYYLATSGSQQVLDALTNGIPQYQGAKLIDAQAPFTFLVPNRYDAPDQGVALGPIYVEASDQFTDYLMFKPDSDGSIWITLRKMSWNWSGIASNTTGSLIMNSQSNSKSNSIDSITLPVWTNYTGNIPFQPWP